MIAIARHHRRCVKRLATLLALGSALFCGCGASTRSDGGGADSESHFMSMCAKDADCPDSLSCECGVCTERCSGDPACESLGRNIECVEASFAACNSRRICALACTEDSDCSEVGNEDLICSRGICQPASTALRLPDETSDATEARADSGLSSEPGDAASPNSRVGSTESSEASDGGQRVSSGADDGSEAPASGTAEDELDAGVPEAETPDASAIETDARDAGGDVTLDAGSNTAEAAGLLALELTDEEIFAAVVGIGPGGIGDCYVYDNTSEPGGCDFYARANVYGVDDALGWPKGPDDTGTGCVYSPNYGRGQSVCYYPDLAAELCTPDHVANVAGHVRNALFADVCGDVGTVGDYRTE